MVWSSDVGQGQKRGKITVRYSLSTHLCYIPEKIKLFTCFSILIEMASVFVHSKPFSAITFLGKRNHMSTDFHRILFCLLFVWDVSTDKWLAFHYHTSVSNTMGSILSQTEKAYIKEILPLSSSFRTIQTKWIQDIC